MLQGAIPTFGQSEHVDEATGAYWIAEQAVTYANFADAHILPLVHRVQALSIFGKPLKVPASHWSLARSGAEQLSPVAQLSQAPPPNKENVPYAHLTIVLNF